MNCRVNHKRMWQGRILLESMHTPIPSSFVTLTYNQEHVPRDGSLKPDDLSKFLNRLRHRSGVGHVRYWAVAEYGDESQRPHFHLAIFGVPRTYSETFANCWHEDGESIGFVHAGDITKESAGYLAGYATKKLTSKDDDRLDGRHPEFTRQSRRPPIGAPGIRHIENMLYTKAGSIYLTKFQDVPTSFVYQGKSFPIGRYWRTWLRRRFNITNPPVNSTWELDYETFTKERERATQTAAKLWRRSKDRASRATAI